MFKRILFRACIIAGSLVFFYVVLLAFVLTPLLQQRELQIHLQNHVNTKILASSGLKIAFSDLTIHFVPFAITLDQFSIQKNNSKNDPFLIASNVKLYISPLSLIFGHFYLNEVWMNAPSITTGPNDNQNNFILSKLKNIPFNLLNKWVGTLSITHGYTKYLDRDHKVIFSDFSFKTRFKKNYFETTNASSRVITSAGTDDYIFNISDTQFLLTNSDLNIIRLEARSENSRLIMENSKFSNNSFFDISNFSLVGDEKILLLLKTFHSKLDFRGFIELSSFSLDGALIGRIGERAKGILDLSIKNAKLLNHDFPQIDLPIQLNNNNIIISDGHFFEKNGTISITKAYFPLTADRQFSGKFKLSGVPSSLLKELNPHLPTQFKSNGLIQVQGTLNPLALSYTYNLSFENFSVNLFKIDNKKKPDLFLPLLHATGTGISSSKQTTLEDLNIKIGNSVINSSGIISHDNSNNHARFKISSSNFDFNAIKKIGNTSYKGVGSFSASTNYIGNRHSVSGNFQFRETHVGDFYLDSVSGRIKYKNNKTSFTNITMKGENTLAKGEVHFLSNKQSKIKISADVQHSTVRFVTKFFKKNPFPFLRVLKKGRISGHVLLLADRQNKSLNGRILANGNNLEAYNEHIEKAYINLSLSKNETIFNDFWIQKSNKKAWLIGKINNKMYDLHLKSELFPLTQFTRLKPYKDTLSGNVHVKGHWTGSKEFPNFNFYTYLDNVSFKDEPYPSHMSLKLSQYDDELSLEIRDKKKNWISFLANKKHSQTPFSCIINFDSLPLFSIVGLVMPNFLIRPSQSKLTLNGTLQGNLKNIYETISGSMNFQSFELGTLKNKVNLLEKKMITVSPELLRTGISFLFYGSQKKRFQTTFYSFPKTAFIADYDGVLDLGIFQPFFKSEGGISGLMAGKLKIVNKKKWILNSHSKLHFKNLKIIFPFLKQVISYKPFETTLRENRLELKAAKGQFRSGQMLTSGHISFDSQTLRPLVNLKSKFTQVSSEFPDCMKSILNGTLALVGSKAPYSLSGKINVISGHNNCVPRLILLKNSPFESELLSSLSPSPILNFNIKVSLDPQSFLMTFPFIKTSIGGTFFIKGNQGNIKVSGHTSSTSGGVNFRNHHFNIKTLSVDLNENDFWKSTFYLQASSNIRSYEVFLTAQGTLEEYNFQFNTVPSLSQRNTLALVFFGSLHSDLSQTNQTQLLQTELGSSLLQKIPLTQSVFANTGLSVHINPNVDAKRGLATPQLTLKSNITNKFHAEFKKDIGKDKGNSLILEYDLSPKVKLRGTYEDETRLSLTPSDGQLGIDLRFRSGFH